MELAKAEANKSALELEMSQLTIQRAQNQIAMKKAIQDSLMKVLGATKDIELAMAGADYEVSRTSLKTMKKIDKSAKLKSVFSSFNAKELEGNNPGQLTKAAERLKELSKEVSREVTQLAAAVEAKQAKIAQDKLEREQEESQLKEIEDSIRSDTLESEELFAALFGRDNWSRMEARSIASGEEGDEERPEALAIKPFVSSKRYESGRIKINPYLLQVDVSTIISLDLSHSDMDDFGANIVSNLLKRGSLPNLKSLDVSGNQFSGVGNKYFAQAAKNVQQPIKILVDTIVNGLKKQGTLAVGIKEAKQNIIKDWLKIGQDNGIDVKNVTVSNDIFDIIVNYGKLQYNFTMGYVKCNIVPESVKSFTADQVIATASKKAGVINTIIGAVTCYFETLDKEMSSQEGVQFITDIGLVGQDELINSVE